MKKIITTILLLFPLFMMAQTAPPILMGSKLYEFRNGLRADSAFFIPRKDTLFFDNTMKAPGMITWRPGDSTIYIYRGDRWISILSSSNPGLALDSARRSNDTLFFRYTTGGELAVKIAGLPISATVGLQDSLNARYDTTRADDRYIRNQFTIEQNANAWIKDFHAKRIGIGRSPGRLFEAVSGTALFAWNGKNLALADDTTININTWIGYKSGIAASGGQNSAYGYASGEFLNGNWNTIAGYGTAIATIGNGNTINGFKGLYNSNSNFSSGFGHQVFYDVYGNNNSAIGANIIINSNSYKNIDTIHASDINNTVISGVKIRSIIDALGLRDDSIYIGKLRWLTTLPVNGSPTFYKFSVDSVAGTLTSQTYSHNVDTGAGLIVINILPRINSTSVIGANATIDTSNQVVLGDTTAMQMKTGRWKWDIGNVPADGDVWTYNNTRKRWTTGALSSTFANKQNAQLMKFNYIGGAYVANPVIAVNPSGWDQGINELGNVIKVGSTYIMVYSGFITPYVQDAVYIGLATSTDGITWTKGGAGDGKILTTPSEDPYIVYNGGTYYLYVEKKISSGTFHGGVQLFTSTNLTTWTDQGVVVDKGTVGTWDENDASSPTVLLENGAWTMLYEGRSPTQAGAVGVATSSDGITWTKYGSNPVMGGTGTLSTISWALNVVPDDVTKIEGKYYLSFHGSHPSQYSGGMAISSNLLSWKDYLGSWLHTDGNNESTGDGIMYYFDGNEYIANYVGPGGGIYRGRLVIKDDYSIGSKPISTTGNLAAGATTITGTLNVSGTSTLAAITATTGTFSGLVAMSSGYTTNNNALNWFIPSAQGGSSSTNAKFLFGGASNVFFRRATGGTTTVTLTTGVGYAGTVIGGENVTKFTSGSHNTISTVALKPPRILGSGADVLLGAAFYSDSATTGAFRNYNFYFNQGDIGIGKGQLRLSITPAGNGTDSVLVKGTDSLVRSVASRDLTFNGAVVATGTYSYQNLKLNSSTEKLDRYNGEYVDFVTLSTSSTNAGNAEYYINNTNTARTVVIPVATGDNKGRRFTIINSTNDTAGGSISQNVTVDLTTNSVRVNGDTADIIVEPGRSLTIISNGVQWYRLYLAP